MAARSRNVSKARSSRQRSKRRSKHFLVTDPTTSARLGRIKQRDTTPEMIVRRQLSAFGLRYRVRNKDLPGSPDIANRRRRWVVFVHGCFWHHHAGCSRATIPKRNRQFWLDKLIANKNRDSKSVRQLRRMGFRILVVWECETRNRKSLDKATNRLVNLLSTTFDPESK